jgi:hypothetical protein
LPHIPHILDNASETSRLAGGVSFRLRFQLRYCL